MDTGVLRPEAVARSAEVINRLDVALRPFSVLPPFGGRTSKNIEEHKSSQSSICSRHDVYQSKAYPFACEHSEATFKCFCQVSSQTLREWRNKT